MDIKPKVVIKQKGATAALDLKTFQATMRWKTAVDIDLHVLYETVTGHTGEVYFARKSHTGDGFKIELDQDSGVGNTIAAGGYNEENVRFLDTSKLKRALIFTNIYGGASNYASIGAHVLVGRDNRATAPEIEVDLTSTSRSRYYKIAMIDFTGAGASLTSIDEAVSSKPSFESSGQSESKGKSLFNRIFG